ncbi:hypothetical protein K458DRAFT_391232 [Lentithecium fluviatile CBS 122367]|uniref:Uncharacterized protein n=1 Tax=Lentithecium fluviatile CBS 122367 TaxID=1168545 RepID=A0A6G1IVD2_9PLEO|nr:hypothetical protein K458DRAFT_391232 [Lentithecium fluviatile CBS 122367]
MCYKNYTQHSGCGHYGPLTNNPYTPCEPAFQSLLSTRGPSSPPLSPPAEFFPPSRSNTTASKRSSKRFFSMSGVLQRSSSTATSSSRRAVTGPDSTSNSRSNGSRNGQAGGNDLGIPDHELTATCASCPTLKSRTIVSPHASLGQVCQTCVKWLEAMRSMLGGYDKGRGIKGTPAFKEFLESREECVGVAVELGFAVPTLRGGGRRGIMGELGGGSRTPEEGWSPSESDSLYG